MIIRWTRGNLEQRRSYHKNNDTEINNIPNSFENERKCIYDNLKLCSSRKHSYSPHSRRDWNFLGVGVRGDKRTIYTIYE